MARVAYENKLKVYFASAVANPSAPTEHEIAAATYLGAYLTRDGVELGMGQSRVDIASIDSSWDHQLMGTKQFAPSLTLYRDDVDETDGYDLAVDGTAGFLILSEFGEPEDGDKVHVIPVQMGQALLANSSANSPQTFQLHFALTDDPAIDAVVGGS